MVWNQILLNKIKSDNEKLWLGFAKLKVTVDVGKEMERIRGDDLGYYAISDFKRMDDEFVGDHRWAGNENKTSREACLTTRLFVEDYEEGDTRDFLIEDTPCYVEKKLRGLCVAPMGSK